MMIILRALYREFRLRRNRALVGIVGGMAFVLAWVVFWTWATLPPGSTYFVTAGIYTLLAYYVGWKSRLLWQQSGGWMLGRVTAVFTCPEQGCNVRLELKGEDRDDVRRFAHRHLSEVHKIESPAYLPPLRNEGDIS